MNRCIQQKQPIKGSLLGKASLYLLIVIALLHPHPGYSAENFPPIVSRDFAKGLFQGILMGQFSDSTTGIRDAALRSQILNCMTPSMNAAIDKAYPVGVNELDAAAFAQRIDASKILGSAMQGEAEKCLSDLKQKIEQPKPAPTAKPIPFIDMDDLRVNLAALNGRTLRVRAVGHYVLNAFMLKKDHRDTNPLIVDISKVNQEQRKQLLQRCNDFVDGCVLTVLGTVTRQGFAAEHIEF